MIQTIVAKELRALFASPLAWVILAFLQVINRICLRQAHEKRIRSTEPPPLEPVAAG